MLSAVAYTANVRRGARRETNRVAIRIKLMRNIRKQGGNTENSPGPSAGQRKVTRRPTLKRVPKSCRGLWSKAVARAVSAVIFYNVAPGVGAALAATERSNQAWLDLLMLPKMHLNSPPNEPGKTQVPLRKPNEKQPAKVAGRGQVRPVGGRS